MQFSRFLKDFRDAEELSQTELAARLGYKKSLICKLESGVVTASTKFVKKLSAEFDLDKQKLELMCGRIPDDVRRAIAQQMLGEAHVNDGNAI